MKRRYAVCLVASGLMASGVLSSLSASGDTAATSASVGLTRSLAATGPHPSLGDQAQVLSRMIGTWDVEYTDFAKDGTVTHRTGEFIAGWVMDGRAIQDLWIVNASGTRKEREVYAFLHWFDAKSRTWRAAFVDPEHGSLARFTGGPEGSDRYVLETADLGNSQHRWSFNDIRSDSLVFRDESSDDGGKTWKLHSEDHWKRRAN
jgi:hypothetical protein